MSLATGIWSSGKKAIGKAVNAIIPETSHIKEAARLESKATAMHKDLWKNGHGSIPKNFEARQAETNMIGQQVQSLYGMDAAGYSSAKYRFPRNSHERNVNMHIRRNNMSQKFNK